MTGNILGVELDTRYLYNMVGQNMLRTYDVKQIFSEKKNPDLTTRSFGVAKCLQQIAMSDLLKNHGWIHIQLHHENVPAWRWSMQAMVLLNNAIIHKQQRSNDGPTTEKKMLATFWLELQLDFDFMDFMYAQ